MTMKNDNNSEKEYCTSTVVKSSYVNKPKDPSVDNVNGTLFQFSSSASPVTLSLTHTRTQSLKYCIHFGEIVSCLLTTHTHTHTISFAPSAFITLLLYTATSRTTPPNIIKYVIIYSCCRHGWCWYDYW